MDRWEWHGQPEYVDGGFFTDTHFWDCACEKHYIHAKVVDIHCPLCGADEDEYPDSRASEIARGGLFADDLSWLGAYNSLYYDTLDIYDTDPLRREHPNLSDYDIAQLNKKIREAMNEGQ